MSRFHAPISEQIWDSKYRFKEADGTPIDETVEATWERIAHALASCEPNERRKAIRRDFYDALSGFKFLPAGRIIAGAGTDRSVTLFNCFVMGTIPDSMSGIFDMLREAALTMQQGGGIGYDFSTLRPKGTLVKGVAADASGPLTFMDVWDAMCRTVMSAGSRRGAMMATMRCDHPDIMDFVTAKKDPARLRMFNLSVLVTADFMDAVREDNSWALVHEVQPNAKAVAHETPRGPRFTYEVIRARDLWNSIMESTYAQAEPGVIFIDRINEDNNLRYVEQIAATNPCGEQPLPPYGACLLGSINLAALVENPFTANARIDLGQGLEKLVATAIRMMDNVIDVSGFPLPQQREEAKNKRRIGLGVTGLADALAMLRVPYGSDKAVSYTKQIMQAISHASYDASVDLAEEKGAFPLFDKEGFLEEGTHASRLPPDLRKRIWKHGIRNALLTSIAPTGTISLYAGNVSSGIEPIFAYEYDRKVLEKDGSKRTERVQDYAVAKYRELWQSAAVENGSSDHAIEEWSADLLPDYFVSAQTLSPMAHVRMQAAAQEFVDSSISKTINCPEDISFEEFKDVYMSAWDLGCKGCTTYRPNEVTGSVLSVTEETKDIDPRREITDDELRAAAQKWMTGPDKTARFETLKFELKRMGLDKVMSAATPDQRYKLMGMFEPDLDRRNPGIEDFPAPSGPTENDVPISVLTERPGILPGQVRKVKMGDDPALYVTITDLVEDGKVRPFELFINTKNPAHIAWTTALTRMVSAIFRRPQDASFVVEELKSVFDPKGGGFWEGSYHHSTVAAIGQVIEDHMKEIGYGSFAPEELDLSGLDLHGLWTEMGKTGPKKATAGASCPKCHSMNLKQESGCLTCLNCGHSKCG